MVFVLWMALDTRGQRIQTGVVERIQIRRRHRRVSSLLKSVLVRVCLLAKAKGLGEKKGRGWCGRESRYIFEPVRQRRRRPTVADCLLGPHSRPGMDTRPWKEARQTDRRGGVAQEGWTGMRQGGGAVSWCVGAGCATSPWLRNQIALLFVFQACGLEGACSYRAQVCPSLASVCGLCRYWASRPCALVTPMEASGGSYTVPEDTAPAMPRSRAVGASRRCASVCDSGETCVRHWLLLLQSPS